MPLPGQADMMHAFDEDAANEQDTEDVDPFASSPSEEAGFVAYEQDRVPSVSYLDTLEEIGRLADPEGKGLDWSEVMDRDPGAADARDADRMREARRRAAEVQDLQAKHLIAKELATSSKKRWESAAQELVEFLNEAAEELPLFDAPKEPQTPQGEADAGDWRPEPIGSLNLHATIESRLSDAAIITMGGLVDCSAGGKQLTDSDGIGPAKAETIADAVEAFWRHRGRPDA